MGKRSMRDSVRREIRKITSRVAHPPPPPCRPQEKGEIYGFS